MHIDYSNIFLIVLALLAAVLGVGRMTRVLVYDQYPPTVWLRERFIWITRDRDATRAAGNGEVVPGGWSKLATCWWCATPWIMVVCIAWGWATSLSWPWWAFWGTLGLAYLSAMVIERDDRVDSDGE